jgi:hypothetical protein
MKTLWYPQSLQAKECRDITWNLATNNYLHFISKAAYFARPIIWCYASSGTDRFLKYTQK